MVRVRAPRATLHLAVAATDAARKRGLMHVHSIRAGEGMLFVFTDPEQRRYVWMKDTFVPLDIVFVDHKGVVTSVESNVPASVPREPESRVARRDGFAAYIIELRAGNASRAGIVEGTSLPIPSPRQLRRRDGH
jgi:uncharacterized protein